MLMHLVTIFLKLKFTYRYILHDTSIMYAASLQNKHIFSPGFEPQTSEVGVECVTTLPPCC